jgi:hypothetical protein
LFSSIDILQLVIILAIFNINFTLLLTQPLGDLDCLPVKTADRPNPGLLSSAGFANPAGAGAGNRKSATLFFNIALTMLHFLIAQDSISVRYAESSLKLGLRLVVRLI